MSLWKWSGTFLLSFSTSSHSLWDFGYLALCWVSFFPCLNPQPSNVLLDTDCVVKLCDFGLARSLKQFQEDSCNPALTEYVATRWYRAPEILLGSARYYQHLLPKLKQLMITFWSFLSPCDITCEWVFLVQRYTKGVDIWSLGCILGEMLLGKALFPGTSTINQIEKIISAIPHPSPEGEKIQTLGILILAQNIHECDFIHWCFIFQTFWQSDLNMGPRWFRGCYWSKKRCNQTGNDKALRLFLKIFFFFSLDHKCLYRIFSNHLCLPMLWTYWKVCLSSTQTSGWQLSKRSSTHTWLGISDWKQINIFRC